MFDSTSDDNLIRFERGGDSYILAGETHKDYELTLFNIFARSIPATFSQHQAHLVPCSSFGLQST